MTCDQYVDMKFEEYCSTMNFKKKKFLGVIKLYALYMPFSNISPALLSSLQSFTSNIRNICVLAHVDHGKTTLSDCLISSNGIISQHMAGKLRYLDFLEDEQEREITMKASSISLLYQEEQKNYLVNLIDSPGHVDFSSEVSTAVRITDGALVLVDAIEGVCIQTHAVLRQAYQERVRPCLVINKIDRLITEVNMTPLEAYQHIKKVIEQVNAITGTLSSEEIILKEIFEHEQQGKETTAEDSASSTSSDSQNNETTNNNDIVEEADLETIGSEYHFSPEKGNVAFTTALDGWGFTINQFVDLCHKKTGIKKTILSKTLWGDYYYHPKDKKIYKSPRGNLTPMFVTFILNSVWELHKCVTPDYIDRDRVDKIIQVLNIKVHHRDLASKDPKVVLQALLQSWLPLSDAVLSMVVQCLPNPIDGQQRRMERIFKPVSSPNVPVEMKEKQQQLLRDTKDCKSDDTSEVVAYVAKVFVSDEKRGVSTNTHRPVPPRRVQPSAVPLAQRMAQASLNENSEQKSSEQQPPTPTQPTQPTTQISKPLVRSPLQSMNRNVGSDDSGEFVAVVRVFSGTLKKGQKVFIMGPRFDPLNPTHDVIEIEITHLYLLMGRSLEPIEAVPAGNVCGVGGEVGNLVLKSATISTTLQCPPLVSMMFVSSPIVKVAIEPENILDMPKLVHGLKMLNQADPLVEVYVQESGEHVIVASGELHLERCIRDLKEIFAKINVNVSSPIVPFRETIILDANKSPVITSANSSDNRSELIVQPTANRMVRVKVRAIPLPKNISDFLENNTNTMRDLFLGGKKKDKELESEKGSKKEAEEVDREEFQKKLLEEFTKAGESWPEEIKKIWAFGPKHIGPNLLLNHIPGYCDNDFWIPAIQRGVQSLKKMRHRMDEEAEDKKETNDQEDQEENEKDSEPAEETESNSESGVTKLLEGEEKFKKVFELENSIVSGFQLATFTGPLCDEPMMGVCMVVEDIEFVEGKYTDQYGPISGQIISSMKQACVQAFQVKPQRLMEALYLCEIQVSSAALGKMYSVLASRRAQIIKEGMKEGTPIFCIQARLPVVESFGFSQQIMIKTSGSASTQLFFDNYWETMEQDPFFQLSTEEELEDHGVNVASLGNNIARQYMDKIRKRKGLAVEEKLVVHADKQRTLKKNK
ncbi:elongation factor Tu domain-containing protein [Heterostelium album PN500]|uniref:Ribosome assembly protein 1 n=1 Tax=Heterostelium pallidum (strain ATCC 26659 / Pp 5 / PN500) TaxID=670386 RepID=D3B1G6_HETP5|nr:elongation factor Tu domain-containing protein [Heterostelium album PN500]EFA85140.1 elongation factor Tu domain-containing protein [Heterostelium album PN500]|eukprot:XP_020437249.1 elongation factor Tu domain-containing protein [Heterostelium album PN500]